MKRALFITNIPSPYRVDFFSFLQKNYPQYEFHVLFSGAGMENRKWSVELRGLSNYTILKSKTIIIRKRFDDRYVFVPVGVERALAEIKPDAVFAMEYNPTILCAVHWCRRKKIPFVSWTDGTLYLTVDIHKYLREKSDYGGRQLLYVGSLIQRKGLDLLLPALEKTPEDIRLVIVGEGQEKEALTEQAAKLGISDRIEFRGYVEGEALRELYNASDIFVLPTREDCFGLVILEAMCASLPVVSSKYADGAADLIEEDGNGKIVDPEDTDAFAGVIEELFSDEERLARMGKRSYEKAQEFAFDRVAEGCVEALEYIL